MLTEKITPFGDRILVYPLTKSTSKQGVIIPENSKTKSQEGRVVSVGSVKSVKIGDQILYGKYTGVEIQIEETGYLVLKEDDVLGVVNAS